MVLFFNLKCWESVFPIMANLASTVAEQGVSARQVICPPRWKCDALRPVKPDPPNCRWGRERLQGFLREGGGEYISAEEFCDSEIKERAERVAASLTTEPRPSYNGILLDEVIKASLARYLRGLYDPKDDKHQAARSQYLRDAVCWIDTATRILDETAPEAIVIWGGTFYAERILAILAQRRGIRTIAVENTAFADRIYVDTAGVTGNRHTVAHNWHWLETRALTPAERQSLYAYLPSVHAGTSSWVSHPRPGGREEICEALGIDPRKRFALLLGQVAIDSVVMLDSPIFSDMKEFIATTAAIVADYPDYQLIVRLHPAEALWHDNLTLGRLEKAGWRPPANCSVVHSQQLNTYDLMRESELGITLCSQAGLEMLSMCKPVVCAGQAFYAGKGLTFDVPGRAAYPGVLAEALHSPILSDAQQEGVEKLLYHLIFEHLVPFDRQNYRVTAQGAKMLVTQGAFRGLAAGRDGEESGAPVTAGTKEEAVVSQA